MNWPIELDNTEAPEESLQKRNDCSVHNTPSNFVETKVRNSYLEVTPSLQLLFVREMVKIPEAGTKATFNYDKENSNYYEGRRPRIKRLEREASHLLTKIRIHGN